MPTTPRGIPYPGRSEIPDGPNAFQALATAVNAIFDAIYTQLNAATPFLVPGALVRRAADSRINVPIDPSAEENAASAGYVNRMGMKGVRFTQGAQLGGVATLTEITQLTHTFTVVGNRWVDLQLNGQLTSDVAGCTVGVRILVDGQGFTDISTGVAIASTGYSVAGAVPYALGPGTYTARAQLGKFSNTPGLAYITPALCVLKAVDLGPR